MQAWARSGPFSGRLGRQAPTAPRSATRQHLAAVFRCHPSTKTMISLALQNAGLKCPLHNENLVACSRLRAANATDPPAGVTNQVESTAKGRGV